MALNYVELPFDYFPNFNKGRPLFGGKIYIGKVGTDPSVEANQKQVYIQEAFVSGTTPIPVSQPITISSGGVPQYNGSPVIVTVEGDYSILVLDKDDSQEYYYPSVRNGVPINADAIANYTTINFDTVANAQAGILPSGDTVTLKLGDLIRIEERGNALFKGVSAGTANGFDVLDFTSTFSINFELQVGDVVDAVSVGCVAGVDSGDALEAALALNKQISFKSLNGLMKITNEISAPHGINFISDGVSGISGYDGLGVRSSGNVTLKNIVINGFNDGTDQNKTNVDTSFCRIATGSQLDKVLLDGVKSRQCRSLVVAGLEGSETQPDITIGVDVLTVKNCNIQNGSTPVSWRALCNNDNCYGNTYKNIIGAGREISAHKVFVDGGVLIPEFKLVKNHKIYGNLFDTIINRTTTGDSTNLNNYETHAVILSGVNVDIHDNIVNDCTGNRYDCEALYIKASNYDIHDNILIDAGVEEGAINLKGENPDTTGVIQDGSNGKCHDNIIMFTKYSYDNDGTIIDFSNRLTGIHSTACSNVDIFNNKIHGANNNDIRINGSTNSVNENCNVVNNKSYGFKGSTCYIWRGAFENPVSSNNTIYNPTFEGSLFYHTRFLSVSNRGIQHTDVTASDNKLTGDVSGGEMNGSIVSIVVFDCENYAFTGDTLSVNNKIKLDVGAGTPDLRPIYVTSQTGSYTGYIEFLKVKYDSSRLDAGINIVYSGNPEIRSFDYDIKVSSEANDTTETVLNIPINYNLSVIVELDATYKDNSNNALVRTEKKTNMYGYTLGALTNIGGSTQYEYSTLTNASTFFSFGSDVATVRFDENGTNPCAGIFKITAKSI